MAEKQKQDPYLRFLKDLPKPPLGMSLLDYARIRPGSNISRGREVGLKEEQRTYCRDPEELLCRGVVVGIGPDKIVRHFWPGNDQKFVGFALINLEQNRILVMTRGAIFLRIPGVTDQYRGAPVYACGPNTFTLDNKNGYCVEIGKLRFCQPDQQDQGSVSFKRYDDPKDYELFLK